MTKTNSHAIQYLSSLFACTKHERKKSACEIHDINAQKYISTSQQKILLKLAFYSVASACPRNDSTQFL